MAQDSPAGNEQDAKLHEIIRQLSSPNRQPSAQGDGQNDTVKEDGVATTPQAHDGGIFGDASSFEKRYIPDYNKLAQVVETFKSLGNKIVLTSGSFDMVHIGHAKYIEAASKYGDLLIVGVDNDEKIRQRKKGSFRPLVPEDERLRMLSHIRGVGLVTLKTLEHDKWALIKAVKPDTLIATEESYNDEQLQELRKHHCGQVVVLERQADTSTSERLRQLQIGISGELAAELVNEARDAINDVLRRYKAKTTDQESE